LELPQETADSAAQMRRVIIDQIEALAELNRIVARHGRGLDAIEPTGRRAETVEAVPATARRPMPREVVRELPRDLPPDLPREIARDLPEPQLTNGGGPRAEPPARQRADIGGIAVPPVIPGRRAEAPSLSPAQPAPGAGGGRAGWLSDLLTRASQEAEATAPIGRTPAPVREAPAREAAPDLPGGHSIESLDSLAVDIAR